MKSSVAVGLVVGALALGQAHTNAQNPGIYGVTFVPGQNLFGNPFQNGNDFLSTIFSPPPDGTTVELWDSVAGAFVLSSTYESNAWTTDLEIPVGVGARLTLPGVDNFTNSFYGETLTGDGVPTAPGAGVADMIPPSMYVDAGTNLLSSITPWDLPLDPSGPHGSTNSVFDWLVGRKPQAGERFQTLTLTTTFVSGAWNNGVPSLGVGEAAFFTLRDYVPEPSTAALVGVAGAALFLVRRRR